MREGGGEIGEGASPGSPHISADGTSCSTLQDYLARLIALASLFRKFLFMEEKNPESPNSWGCSRHLTTLSNPEPARNILVQVTIPELTPSSWCA